MRDHLGTDGGSGQIMPGLLQNIGKIFPCRRRNQRRYQRDSKHAEYRVKPGIHQGWVVLKIPTLAN
jgi:hypothetical protein